ncbi:MAG TPA: hypothetical protein VH092_10790 [Urbifossiella sp.]|nr:hypothetical protein [Urbifossiella sp.]
MTAEATWFDKRIESVKRWQQGISYAKGISAFLAVHALFWIGLVVAYPYSRWVQAFFFWNPWVRKIAGLVYVPWVITLVPSLRRRLLRPFQPNLIPDRFRHEFQGESYFGECRVTAIRDGRPVTHPANQYFKPPLQGPRVVEAPSGYGKTTLLQWYVQQPGNPRVVLMATECNQGVMEAIQKCLLGIARDAGFLQTLVYSGGLEVIIDGLNEADPETREKIRTFVNDYFRGNYLLTTQPVMGYKVPRAAELWKLQPLATDQARAFLIGQWPRVEAAAAGAGVDRERYEVAVQKLLDDTDPEDGPDSFGLATPLDAALVADLIALNVEPELNALVAQHVRLARDGFRRTAPAGEPAFDRVGGRALEAVRGPKPGLDLSGLEREREALLERKLLINHGTEYAFRHDRIRDYFIALSIPGVDEALSLRKDTRLTGAFEFLPDTLDKVDADELGEILKTEAADGDARVWSKYKPRWKPPGRVERIEGLLREATTRFRDKNPGETPDLTAIGGRVVDAIRADGPPNWTGLEPIVESLLAAHVMRAGSTPTEPARFRSEDLRWYFVALNLSSLGALNRAKELGIDDRFARAFEFLPRLLDKPARDELGQHLETASAAAGADGPQPCPAWELYRKNWRRRKSGVS